MKLRLAVAVTLVASMAAASPARAIDPTTVASASRSVVLVETSSRLGTAFAFGGPGDYLTNAHVLAGASTVIMIDPDGRHQTAEVIASDSNTDVAELRGSVALAPLKPAVSAPAPGESVMTVGSPAGLQGTVTAGIVSAVGRRVGTVPMIQVDLAVNPGNSGGPLLDASGRVLGIVSEKASGEDGIAFAIPLGVALDAVHAAAKPGSPTPTNSAPQPVGLPAPLVTPRGVSTGWWLAGVATLAGVIGLSALLWRRTRRQAFDSRSPEEEVRLRGAVRRDQDDLPIVIRHSPGRANPDTNSQRSEETWT